MVFNAKAYQPCSITCCSKVFRGLRDFRQNSTKTYVFLVVLHLIINFLFRMYFYNSIFILNGETTYLIWHTVLKFSYIPPFTER